MSAVAEILHPPRTLEALLGDRVPAPPVPVSDISLDSRRVTPGCVFFACRGHNGHGLEFAGDAVARGAAAIVWEPPFDATVPLNGGEVPMVALHGLRSHLGALADRWFDAPSARINVTGITGTNGKTSVAWLLAAALGKLGEEAAYLGTLGAGAITSLEPQALTTPDVIELHRQLDRFAGHGFRHACLEVSSHALDQRRTDGVRFQAAAFTNLSRDHLDYHGDMERYGAAKARLMAARCLRHRIINVDDGFGAELFRRYADTALAVGSSEAPAPGRQLAVRDVRLGADGIRFAFTVPGTTGVLESPLVGAFNVANLAVALGVLLETGCEAGEASAALAAASAPPGRLQRIGTGGPLVVVDYAHTPSALDAAIAALRPHCTGKLWCVFGCGGERDAGKRPLMGRVAEAADRVIVTSDNPRGEQPDRIIGEIIAGMSAPAVATVEEDRRAAIRIAVEGAAADDCILIAGRGHERFQITAAGPVPFEDAVEARAALGRRSSA